VVLRPVDRRDRNGAVDAPGKRRGHLDGIAVLEFVAREIAMKTPLPTA